jgi:aryl-alcohol dehydrogenase-like predicted oxidoreductase
MQTRTLGNSDLKVSVVGIGCNNFGGRMDFDSTRAVVHKALDLGITLFDTADAYGEPTGGSETDLGKLLGARRKDIVLATKFGLPMDDSGQRQGASRRYIMEAVEASLKRLRTDWIDLYQVHKADPSTPAEETMRALDDLVKQGKVRHIGCSNYSAAQIKDAQKVARENKLMPFISCQDQYSLLARGVERDLLPAVEAERLGFLPYFPLASGLLTGKYRRNAIPEGSRLSYSGRHIKRFISDENWQVLDALNAFCDRTGRPMLDVAFGWLLSKPYVASVIAGATRPEQLEQNVAAAGWTPSAAEQEELNRLTASRVADAVTV